MGEILCSEQGSAALVVAISFSALAFKLESMALSWH